MIQLIQAGRPEAQWAADSQGLTAKDLAMQVVLPELDGRHRHAARRPQAGRRLARSAPSARSPPTPPTPTASAAPSRWRRTGPPSAHTPRAERRVAIVLANYPIRDGRLANGVGYDAPQSTVEILKALRRAGFSVGYPLPLRGRGAMATHGRGG